MKNRKWISNEVLNWNYRRETSTILDRDDLERAYEIWEHAKELIENGISEFHLGDGITNLKRALNHRLHIIEQIYSFKTITINNKPKGYFELLELLGIVRPFLMKQLLQIRNDIEHRDARPPSIERCKELLDIIWYFLKSTDYLVQVVPNELVFEEDEDDYDTAWLSIEYMYGKDEFAFRGWLPEKFVFEEPVKNTFEVEFEEDKFRGKVKFEEIEKLIMVKKILLTFG